MPRTARPIGYALGVKREEQSPSQTSPGWQRKPIGPRWRQTRPTWCADQFRARFLRRGVGRCVPFQTRNETTSGPYAVSFQSWERASRRDTTTKLAGIAPRHASRQVRRRTVQSPALLVGDSEAQNNRPRRHWQRYLGSIPDSSSRSPRAQRHC